MVLSFRDANDRKQMQSPLAGPSRRIRRHVQKLRGWRPTRRVGSGGASEASMQTLHRMVSRTCTNKLLLEE